MLYLSNNPVKDTVNSFMMTNTNSCDVETPTG